MHTPWEGVLDKWKVELKYPQPPGSFRLKLEQHWNTFYSVFQSSPRRLATIFHSVNLFDIIPLFFGGWGMCNNFFVFPASHFAFIWIICQNKLSVQFSSVHSLSRVRLFVTPWITAHQPSMSINNSQSSLRLNVHRVSDAIQPSHPLSSPSPPAPQSLPASESFPMSQLFAWGGQSTGASASASFPPKKSQGWSPSEWTGWISLHSKGLSRVFSNTTVQKHQFFGAQLSSIFSHY